MKLADVAQFNLPDAPGVYYFLRSTSPHSPSPGSGRGVDSRAASGGEVLYVGKATSLKDRVKSYFTKDLLLTRGPKVERMVAEATKLEWQTTDSVLEAMILEANEIKRLQPVANSKEKDDRSYNYVGITKEDFPRILIVRGRDLESKLEAKSLKLEAVFGPYPHGGELKEALKIIRKIFPYRDAKCEINKNNKPCFNAQIGLCPGPCAGLVSKAEYGKTVRNIKLFFEGKKDKLVQTLEREMLTLAKKKEFEKAEEVKKKIFALTHIQDIALIKSDLEARGYQLEAKSFRIEAYDIAHISGTNVVGVMTVVEDGEVNKSQYRKFKIRADRNDDVNNLRELVSRRLAHAEWRYPNLIVVDGGKGQINAVREVLKNAGLDMIDLVAVVKDSRHKAREVVGSRQYVEGKEREILLANSEAHRFAINYHRLLRSKGFRI